MLGKATGFGEVDAGAGSVRGGGILLRCAGAAVLTGLLLVFLVLMRWLDFSRIPDRTVREVEMVEAVALPAPPPPPENPAEVPPPPPAPPRLPQLEVKLDRSVPPVPSSPDSRVDLTMRVAEFEWEADPAPEVVVERSVAPRPPSRPTQPSRPEVARPVTPPPMKSVYSAGELDAKPRLLNSPSASYPSALLRRGVREGRALLEVSVSTSGRVTVLRVLQASQPEFATMARSVASRARFSVPKKNGRPVTAIYNWPLILRP